jgi:hypothetical protein
VTPARRPPRAEPGRDDGGPADLRGGAAAHAGPPLGILGSDDAFCGVSRDPFCGIPLDIHSWCSAFG